LAGTIAGGIISLVNNKVQGYAPAANGIAISSDLSVSAYIDNAMYYKRANVTQLESIRHVYFPLDPTYETFINTNESHGVTGQLTNTSGGSEFLFVYYITGAASGAAFNVILNTNYECLPRYDAFTQNIAVSYEGKERVQNVVSSFSSQEELISQVGKDVSKDVMMEEKHFTEVKDGSFLDKTMDFLGEHLPDIGDISAILGHLARSF
jgi:hypothetical protein